MKKLIYLFVAGTLLIGACKTNKNGDQTKENSDKKATTTEVKENNNATSSADLQAEADDKLIKAYLLEKGLTDKAKSTESGIYYVLEGEGSGEHPKLSDEVKVHYTGTLLDGTQFDSSVERGDPITFPLTRVVKGWQEGIPLISKGQKGTLIIPSGLAYGSRARPSIPANSVLVFDVELFDFFDPSVKAKKQAEEDAQKITDWLKEKKLTSKAKSTESGIYYIIEKEGTGANPTIDSKVEVHYTGTLLDGTKFDSSVDRGQPAKFPLKGVVKGWQEGIPLLKKGGKGKLVIPSALAYGPQGRPSIPPNSVLVFDVELLGIE